MIGQSLSNTNETCDSVQIAKNCNLNKVLFLLGLVLSLSVGTVACFGVVSQQQQEIETGKQNASQYSTEVERTSE